MNKLFIIGLVFGTLMASSGFASGPAGSGPGSSGSGAGAAPGPAASSTGPAPGGSSYASGATSSEQADANSEGYSELDAVGALESRGYSDFANLNKDKDGTWRATAKKGNKIVSVSLDSNGNVVAD